ncbi:hypothetical protein H0H87_011509 [Tephrocybe sp. NHM501043]|nr:hypothetical protein H0H87_011509 [Tephrocybe sp. NHM501043]
MFWSRFGFHNASAIDSLLDKEDVQLEAILDEDDLLQECKSQNTRLIDYFQRVDVLQKLFAYVTEQIEGDEKGRFKYPYVATEVLCSEIWSIVETCINEQQQLLIPFWETVLDRSAEDMKTRMIMVSHFSKVNAVFLSKKPAEMFAFIRSQPRIVERLLIHVESPPLVDLIIRIIQLDEQPSGAGVLEWLSSENFMGRLIELLSPTHTSDVHAVVADLIKGIISMSTPSPGAGLTEGLHNGPASNRFARELAEKGNVEKLASYMLIDFEPPPISEGNDEEDEDDPRSQLLPNFNSKTSSVVQSISMVIELIRKNNSDFFEPYLFHTLRNRLVQVQQQIHDDERDALELAMKEMADRMGVVHLGPVLEVMMPILGRLQHFLLHPRSLIGPVETTVGTILPLTLERWRISELFAELLHCSNMSLLNRSPEMARLYNVDGRLNGGLAALEDLAQVLSISSVVDHNAMGESTDSIAPALELPITGSHDSMSMDSDDSMSDDEPGSSDDEAMEEIVMYDEPSPQAQPELSPISIDSSIPQPPLIVPSSPDALSMPPIAEVAAQGAALRGQTVEPEHAPSSSSQSKSAFRRNSRRTSALNGSQTSDNYIPVGERLKQCFLDVAILSTLLVCFTFSFLDFGMTADVYDVIHQILNAPVESGLNRELAISLFRDARLMDRIVDGQKRNDTEMPKNNGARLGYMGHLTLMAEDVLSALEHFPPELRLILITYAPSPGWDDYVVGRYNETKGKDQRQLGGGKPTVASGVARNVSRWKVDEGDGDALSPMSAIGPKADIALSEPRGEFRRAGSSRPVKSTADFGPAPVMEEPEEAPHFARYLAQEMHTRDSDNTSDDDDDDEEEGGWLSQSTFSLSPSPVSARQPSERRPLSALTVGFDDGFGPFSDAAAAATHNGGSEFTFGSSFDDSFDDSFGDFGDFQSAESMSGDGEGSLTPTTGSWTFASDPGTDSEEDPSMSVSPPKARVDMFGFSGKTP